MKMTVPLTIEYCKTHHNLELLHFHKKDFQRLSVKVIKCMSHFLVIRIIIFSINVPLSDFS